MQISVFSVAGTRETFLHPSNAGELLKWLFLTFKHFNKCLVITVNEADHLTASSVIGHCLQPHWLKTDKECGVIY